MDFCNNALELLALIDQETLIPHVDAIVKCLDKKDEHSKNQMMSALKVLARFEPPVLLPHAPSLEAFLRREDIPEEDARRDFAKELLGTLFEPGAAGSVAARDEFDAHALA